MNEDGCQESKWDTQLIRQAHRELFKDKLLPEGKLTIRWSCKAKEAATRRQINLPMLS